MFTKNHATAIKRNNDGLWDFKVFIIIMKTTHTKITRNRFSVYQNNHRTVAIGYDKFFRYIELLNKYLRLEQTNDVNTLTVT